MSGELGTLGDSERCHRCDGENVTWFAPSPVWNFVMRGNDINGDPIWGDLVCMRCFVVLAEQAGIKGRWRLTPDPEPAGLIYETPSGRVWDPKNFRWGPDPWLCRHGMTRDEHSCDDHRDRQGTNPHVDALRAELTKEDAP